MPPENEVVDPAKGASSDSGEQQSQQATPSLADAIQSGIESASPKPVAEAKPAAEAKPEDDVDGKEGKEGAETPEQKAAREAAEAEALKNETPEQKAAREKAEADKAKRDPVNDPIDPRVSERTKERITSLVGMVKEKDQLLAENRQLFQSIADTGVSPDNFAQTLQLLRWYNSDSIEDNRKAYQFLQTQLTGLAARIGETPPGADPLEGHDDLRTAVNAGQMTEKYAAELAAARNRSKAAQSVSQEQSQRSKQEAEQYEAARTTAVTALNALGDSLKDVDPQYDAKAPLVIAKLQPVFATLHPSKWVDEFRKEYKATKVPGAAASGAQAPQGNGGTPPAQQPLRPNKQPAGGGQKQPGNMLEALEAGLSQLKS